VVAKSSRSTRHFGRLLRRDRPPGTICVDLSKVDELDAERDEWTTARGALSRADLIRDV